MTVEMDKWMVALMESKKVDEKEIAAVGLMVV